MEHGNFGLYRGDKLMALNLPKREFLMDNFIREKDSIIFVGDEKSGKSICIFQMICSLTSGHPFLDRFSIKKECKVVYIQLEGELEDTIDRLQRMSKVIDFKPDNLLLDYSPALDLQEARKVNPLVERYKDFSPDIVLIDPAYFAFTGDLSDNKIVRMFTSNMRAFKNKLNCALAIVHHTHRSKKDIKGKSIQEGDEAIFGSKFFKAWADHTLLFTYDKKNNTRRLSCETQRSGDVNESATLKMIQPDPLYFVEISTMPSRASVVLDAILRYASGATREDIENETSLAKATVYRALTELVTDGRVIKDDSRRPVRYKLVGRQYFHEELKGEYDFPGIDSGISQGNETEVEIH